MASWRRWNRTLAAGQGAAPPSPLPPSPPAPTSVCRADCPQGPCCLTADTTRAAVGDPSDTGRPSGTRVRALVLSPPGESLVPDRERFFSLLVSRPSSVQSVSHGRIFSDDSRFTTLRYMLQIQLAVSPTEMTLISGLSVLAPTLHRHSSGSATARTPSLFSQWLAHGVKPSPTLDDDTLSASLPRWSLAGRALHIGRGQARGRYSLSGILFVLLVA